MAVPVILLYNFTLLTTKYDIDIKMTVGSCYSTQLLRFPWRCSD